MRREHGWVGRRIAGKPVRLKQSDEDAESGMNFIRVIIAGPCGLRYGI